MTQMSTDTLNARKRQLIARLAELDTRLHGIEDELLTHQAKDWEELAVEREQDEVLASMGDDGKEEIRMIHAALARVSNGSYGVCMTCGEDISAERLDVLPATPFCRNCAH